MLSECPHGSPCFSIWKEPQCAHKSVLRAVSFSVQAWAPEYSHVCPFGCFVLRFLAVLSVSV